MKKSIISVPKLESFADIKSFAIGKIDITNWAEFPHKPKCEFAIAYTSERLLIRFEVEEPHVIGLCTQMHGEVYEDSCVEFFVREPQDEHYFNFEINCIGTILAARRRSRTEKDYLSDEIMQLISVKPSLPAGIPYEGSGRWSIDLEIPFKALGLEQQPTLLEANLYKCGDKTPVPHFVSWSPIDTPTPDFHRPEYFGMLEFK